MIGAVLACWPYAVILTFVQYGSACTRAGEGLLPGLFLGGPIIVFATLLLWLLRPSAPLNATLKSLLIAALGLGLVATLPQLWGVSVLGHHHCGEEFNIYLEYAKAWDRWIPVINFGLIAVAGFVGLGPYLRKVAV